MHPVISLFVVALVALAVAPAGTEAGALPAPPLLAKFYAPWCGACKRFEPEWSAFEARAATKYPSLSVVSVDCVNDANRRTCQQFGIAAYPTVKFVARAGGEPVEYRGAQTTDALDAWMAGHRLPAAPARQAVSACRTLRKVLKRIVTSDAGCELSFDTAAAGGGGVLSCAFDTGAAIRAALEGRKLESPLVREMAALTNAVVSATGAAADSVALDLEHASSGLLFLRLPAVTAHTILCIL
jgi:thiol-disulfide isomerase/thioredoxin